MTHSHPCHVQEGYRGLLLHYISPWLAEAVYPYANLRLEVVMLLLLVSSAGLSTSTVISIVIPAQVGVERSVTAVCYYDHLYTNTTIDGRLVLYPSIRSQRP